MRRIIKLGRRMRRLVYQRRRGAGNHILVACFWKSGSTYLSTLLGEITGFRPSPLVQFWGNNEQDIFEDKLKEVSHLDTITHQHVKGTENNIRLIREYGLKPLVLTRDISDVVLSMHDHIAGEDHRGPVGYVHQQYFSMCSDEKITFLIRMFLPWYFNFLISWYEASQELPVFWMTYSELFGNKEQTIAAALDFCGLATETNLQVAIEAVQSKNTRLNVGVSGRGAGLHEHHHEAIRQLGECWKVDAAVMRMIGVEC
jgi:hypothetical protein